MFLMVGFLAALYGEIRFLAIAYNRSGWWLLGCLFVPLVAWIFLFLYFKAAIKPFAISLGGCLLAGLGAWMAGVV